MGAEVTRGICTKICVSGLSSLHTNIFVVYSLNQRVRITANVDSGTYFIACRFNNISILISGANY